MGCPRALPTLPPSARLSLLFYRILEGKLPALGGTVAALSKLDKRGAQDHTKGQATCLLPAPPMTL